MERYIYHALLKEEKEGKIGEYIGKHYEYIRDLASNGVIMTLSLFKSKRRLFLYYECITRPITPDEMFPMLGNLLEVYPCETGNRSWIPMLDIFHFSKPINADHWMRKQPVQEHVGKIARIKPEMLSSYIHYHYILQEEITLINNKYCTIGLYENLIFYYEELPLVEEVTEIRNKNSMSKLPSNWTEIWQDLMEPHFILWEDTSENDRKLKTCKLLLSC
jgi:hypothetical protein